MEQKFANIGYGELRCGFAPCGSVRRRAESYDTAVHAMHRIRCERTFALLVRTSNVCTTPRCRPEGADCTPGLAIKSARW